MKSFAELTISLLKEKYLVVSVPSGVGCVMFQDYHSPYRTTEGHSIGEALSLATLGSQLDALQTPLDHPHARVNVFVLYDEGRKAGVVQVSNTIGNEIPPTEVTRMPL